MTEEKAREIISTMFDKQSLKKALIHHGVSPGSFFTLLHSSSAIENLYTETQSAIGEQLAEEIMNIADTEDDAMRAKNRIDARKWYASKVKPKKFGDRIDLNVSQTVDIREALDSAKNRLRQVIELTPQIAMTATGLKPVDAGSTVENALDELLK